MLCVHDCISPASSAPPNPQVSSSTEEELRKLTGSCSLLDMLRFDDPSGDDHLSLNEFYAAFSKLYSKSKPA